MLSPRLPGKVGPVRAFVLTGAWFVAALTVQIIDTATPDSAIRLESTSGDGKFGYRLKSDPLSQTHQLAQYTIFWHHPNGKCYGVSGWGNNGTIAYPDTADKATASAKAPGSDDPTAGSFTGRSRSGTGTTPQAGQ